MRLNSSSRCKVKVFTRQPWDVPRNLATRFSKENIEDTLSRFNQACGKKFYMLDYRKKRFIVDSNSSPVLCGHPKELADVEGFEFYHRILKDDEWQWIQRMNAEAYNVLFSTPIEVRDSLVISYDLTFHIASEKDSELPKEFILHHKVVPYQLCNNGNLWLGLCFVSPSINEKTGTATIINTQTGERYEFDGKVFMKIDDLAITQEELSILEWLVKGITAEKMCGLLKVSLPTFKRKKRLLYEKIGVGSSAEAVHWAHLTGII
jgi:DNA-binding CsgD family transcriptional regulator